ncbi:malonyl-ACP O-methyltransferase BioC [Pasteurella oralis]|uniref:Malonyl-[acyl-carrier protein] O-methyltransferase n=1 Tax=Pasteurella oralis TaxID=1071947 RepID=A0ABW4NXK2_9PAST
MQKLTKQRIKQRFTQALTHYDQQAFAQQQIQQRLIDLLPLMQCQKFENVLELGCGTGGLTQGLMTALYAQHWELNDLCDVQQHLQMTLPQPFKFHCGDAEQFRFSKKYDLIAAASVVQWFEDKQGFIQRVKTGLRKQGFLLLSTFSATNLYEVKQITGIGLDYPSAAQWQQWLVPEFELLAFAQEEIVLTFAQPIEVLKHLQKTGVNAISQHGWTKTKLQHFCHQYQQNYANLQQQVTLTYAPLYLLARLK